uniref:Claudin n=1 Tax=Fundulus heteroclitus TaxID=8078 RepID=A0A3Q2Q9H0_FUNHE
MIFRTQFVGFCLAVTGFMGTILICALPMWKVTPFVGANIVTAQVFWEGLWMNCVIQSTGHLQCKAYDSVLALPQDLQGSRALVYRLLIVFFFHLLIRTKFNFNIRSWQISGFFLPKNHFS